MSKRLMTSVLALTCLAAAADGALQMTDADRVMHGQPGDRAGWKVASADLTGDGTADMVVAAPDSDHNRVYVHTEDRGPFIGALEKLEGSEGGEYGWSLATGDLTGDGIDDLVVGEPSVHGGRGAVHVTTFASPIGAEHWASVDGEAGYAGWEVAVGDVDGDGRDDLAVSACEVGGPLATGRVYVLRGPLLRGKQLDLRDADLIVDGAERYDRLGCGLAFSDLDGDGADELVMGSATHNEAGLGAQGRVWVSWDWQPGTFRVDELRTTHIDGTFQTENLGLALAGGEDVDGDGTEDLLVGAPAMYCAKQHAGAIGGGAPCPADDPGGRAYLFLGLEEGAAVSADEADVVVKGTQAFGAFGISVAMGDEDGDGLGDWMVGSARHAAFLWRGDPAIANLGTIDDLDADIVFLDDLKRFGGRAVAFVPDAGKEPSGVLLGAPVPA